MGWSSFPLEAGAQMKQTAITHRGKKKLFKGWMDLPRRVGWSGLFFFNFFVFGGKNDPKNKIFFNMTFFAENFGKIFRLIFTNFRSHFPDFYLSPYRYFRLAESRWSLKQICTNKVIKWTSDSNVLLVVKVVVLCKNWLCQHHIFSNGDNLHSTNRNTYLIGKECDSLFARSVICGESLKLTVK